MITQLGDEFDRIEKALGKLITEYEQKLPTFRGSPAVLELDQLSVLEGFLASPKRTDHPGVGLVFRPLYDGFGRAQRIIWRELLDGG